MTAFYAFRIVFRVVYGEPVPGGEGARGGPPGPRRGADQPGDRRARGLRRRLPRPEEHHIAEREFPMRLGDERARLRRAVRRLPAGAGRHRGGHALPRGDVRGLDDREQRRGLREGRLHRPVRRRRHLDHRDRRSPSTSTCATPGSTLGLAKRFRARPRLPRPQVVLRRGSSTSLIVPAGARDRAASPTTSSRRSSCRAIVRVATGGVGGLGGAVRGAQSGFVRFYALLVIAGLAGLGALLPDR